MSLKMPELAKEISHLSSEDIEVLYKKYLDGEKNSDLVKEYKIDVKPNNLLKILPPRILIDQSCPCCNIPMYKKRDSKNQSSWQRPPIECFNCEHKIYNENRFIEINCSCKHCEQVKFEEQEAADKIKRKVIEDKCNPDIIKPTIYSELNFSCKLSLLTLFIMQTEEEFDRILPLNYLTKSKLFTPTDEMSDECLRVLADVQAIIVDPQSDLRAFPEGHDCYTINFGDVKWISNVAFHSENRAPLKDVYNKIYDELSNGVQAQWESEIYNIIFKIAREEVLQYMALKADELKMPISATNKTPAVVNQLLRNFSVQEIYYFVRKSVEDAQLYYAKNGTISKKQASNIIPNKMLSLGERALNEKWETYKSNRNSKSPRSAISEVFYDFFLRDKDAGFVKAPGKYWEQELYPQRFSSRESGNIPESCDDNIFFCNDCGSNTVKTKMRKMK
ncbi:hypothetical protein [Aeromonas caviae]|uniref:hypothetical protein n=1 Tax=Aeromonas caviae TaxID=648 RepID=UPI00191E3E33|nr:hypothetical protein [Aeromonas caviae]MBL0451336.1 hypothetical protein [Aeromonas caviae]